MLTALAGLLVTGTAFGQAPLLLRMSFNDDAGNPTLANRGLISFTATLQGTAAYSTDLPPGRASGRSIELFGADNDRVYLGNRPELGGLKSFTIAAWIKPKAFNPGKTYPRIYNAGDSSVFSLANTGDANTNKAVLYVNSATRLTNHRFAFNEWKFVAVTYDGTIASDNLKFYVGDGTNLVLDSTHSAGTGNSGTAGDSYLGATSGTDRNLNGLIDDLRVYGMYEGAGGVLSSQQIFLVMQQKDCEAEDVSWVPQGNLYVAHGPSTDSRIKRYAVSAGTATFVEDLVTGINYARGLDRALDGNLVVADRDNYRLLKGTSGLAPGSFPVFATNGATGMNKPRGVAVRPGNGQVYAAEWEDSEVSWYDTNGTYVNKFAFGYNAHDVAFAGENEMYVVGAGYAKRYDWNGSAWTNAWSVSLSGGNSMAAEVVNGHLYISLNTNPSRVLRVNRTNGAVLSSWYSGGTNATFIPAAGDVRGNLYLSDWTGNSLIMMKMGASGDPESFRRLASGVSANPGWLVADMQFGPQVNNAGGATNVTANSAWLNGTVVATNGQETSAWVYWGLTDGGTNASAWAATNAFGVVGVGPLTHQATGLVADRVYYFRFAASNEGGVAWADASSTFITGEVTLDATDSTASKATGDTGTFTIARPATATNGPLTVAYTTGGSAVAGSDYAALPGSITIADGEATATVTVTPLLNSASGSRTVILTQVPGAFVTTTEQSDTVTIQDAWQITPGETNVWTGTGNWTNAAGWSLGRAPLMGDFVVISNAITVTSSPPVMASLTVYSNVTASGWDTALVAQEIAIQAGWVTHAPNTDTNSPWVPDNRVYMVANTMTIAAGAGINVNAKGYGSRTGAYVGGYGPGAGGQDAGGGYGGAGGWGYNNGAAGQTYGSPFAPADPGSGGGADPGGSGGWGGGAVRLDVNGALAVNGSILANGGNYGGSYGGGGSGGGIYITAGTFSGGAGAAIRVNGGNGSTGGQCGGGGGGRIAIWQTGGDTYAGALSATGGLGGTVTGYGVQNGATGTIVRGVGVYAPGDSTLGIRGTPVAHGTSTPYANDTYYTFAAPQTVTNTVNTPADEAAGQRFALLGWTAVTGSVTVASGSTTQAVFTVTGDTVQTWNWTNEYYLTLSAGAGGTLVADKSGWYTNGVAVEIQAQTNSGYRFVQWSGDVPSSDATNNPLTLVMSQARTLQATFAVADPPMPRTWNGTGLWNTAANWTPSGIPGPGDDLTVATGSLIVNIPLVMESLTVQNGARVVFTNWNSTVSATAVTIAPGGTVTVANAFSNTQMSNNVSFAVSNFTLQAGGAIEVSALGYAGGDPTVEAGSGPGGASGRTAGGSYGGTGGNGVSSSRAPYGTAALPLDPGSGGGGHTSPTGYGGHGGGAVRIAATGTVTLNGSILANGGNYGGSYGGGGSGGGIYITARTIEGTTGQVLANGGNGNLNTTDQCGGGGGGRIALICDPAAQALVPKPTLRLSADRGFANRIGGIGSIRINDIRLLPNAFVDDGGSVSGYGSTWDPSSVFFSNAWVTLAETGLTLNVAGDLRVVGVSRVELADGTLLTLGGNLEVGKGTNRFIGGSLTLTNSPELHVRAGGDVRVAGSVRLNTNANVYVYAPLTNDVVQTGTVFRVGGTMVVSSNAWVYPQCSTNGGIVVFEVPAVTVAAGGGFNAQGRGWPGAPALNTTPSAAAHGPGRGKYFGGGKGGGGGGYGGVGGGHSLDVTYGATYGDSNAPALPGSGGGGGDNAGGAGGGVIVLEAEQVTLDGTLNADGGANLATSWQGGGSGGSIFVRCHRFAGNGGMLRAKGGTGGTGNQTGAGGGGRIAIWRAKDSSIGVTANVDPGDGGNLVDKAEGTVVWWMLSPRGTVFVVH